MTRPVPTLLRWIEHHPQEGTGPGLQQQTPQPIGTGASVTVGDGVGAAVGGGVGCLVGRPFPVGFLGTLVPPPFPPFNLRVRLSPAGKDASSSIKLDSSLPLNETKGRLFSTTR